MTIPTGRHIGNFEIVRLIGEGGFGEVYEAENPLLRRRVAIKVLHGGLVQDTELVRRFLNEARAATGIHHPNIIEVFDAGITPEHEPYIVMEYLEGRPLQQVIASRGKLSLNVAQAIVRQACSALGAAHAAGIVHRDLKPENIFILESPTLPDGLQVKVLDFGIAKIKHNGERGQTVKTRTGLIMGSPAYMSPEQCKDSSDVDLRTDVYSMGVIAYELLSGAPPFMCEAVADLLVMQVVSQPQSLRSVVPDVPRHVEQAVMRALAKNREERFDSMDEFVAALLGPEEARSAGVQADHNLFDAVDTGGGARGPLHGKTAGGLGSAPSLPVGERSAGARPRPPASNVTTYGHARGETKRPVAELPGRAPGNRASRRRARWTMAGAATTVLLAAGVGLLLFGRGGGNVPQSGPATSLPAVPTGTSSAPALVRLHLQTVPAGATVTAVRDGRVLGQTPIDRQVQRIHGPVAFTLRLSGYRDETVSVSLDADASSVVRLQALAVENDPTTSSTAEAADKKKRGSGSTRRKAGSIAPAVEVWMAH